MLLNVCYYTVVFILLHFICVSIYFSSPSSSRIINVVQLKQTIAFTHVPIFPSKRLTDDVNIIDIIPGILYDDVHGESITDI